MYTPLILSLSHTHTHTQVLQIMLPLRYDLIRLGGSWAQRQVFNVTMIQAAIKANKPSVALALVTELKVSNNKRMPKSCGIHLYTQAAGAGGGGGGSTLYAIPHMFTYF